MSLARVYTTKGAVRKDGLKCGKCGTPIVKGQDRRITFAVGFRGYEQTRCLKPGCYPTMAERESSAVATVYGAIEGQDIDSLESLEDLESYRDEIVAACEEVADEYESNEMIEINTELQERADTVRAAGEELSNWSPEDDEPSEDNEVECSNCDGSGRVTAYDEDGEEDGEEECEECSGTGTVEGDEDAHDEWLTNARESLREAIDSMELP